MSEHRPDEQQVIRRDKLAELRRQGVDPYPVGFRPTHRSDQLHATYPELEPGSSTGLEVSVAGRLVGLRDMGKLAFGVLQDAGGRIQLFVDRSGLDDRYDEFVALDLGDVVGVSGEVITTRKGELSVRVGDFQLQAKALHPMPEKYHGLVDTETRYRQRYLDLIANEDSRRVFDIRTGVVRSLRATFEERGFVEVETPMLQIQPGGAIAKPFVTHHNALDLDMYLRIAPELYLKRLVVGGMDKVFELNRNFRNEGLSPRHNPEFTMLESYEAYADYEDVMELVEEAISQAALATVNTTSVVYQGRDMNLAPPYARIDYVGSVAEALKEDISIETDAERLRNIVRALGLEIPDGGTGKLFESLFEELVEPKLWDPVFVVDMPTEISPLARAHRSRPGLAERFELFMAGREIANAFTELNDPAEQRARFEMQAAARASGDDEAHPIDEDYLLALEYGMPPTGGLGIGVDRLIMVLADVASIRDVILFPHLRPEGARHEMSNEEAD
ncbi:MAG: lysine--tRNA ligase [Acidimicrobiia bacterium]|nr:lysine--tRNA ligase [Acidimicrobiia bacterium]NNL46759.1 lysine--tRNA ligase [Acidimicrobiia bacterium]